MHAEGLLPGDLRRQIAAVSLTLGSVRVASGGAFASAPGRPIPSL